MASFAGAKSIRNWDLDALIEESKWDPIVMAIILGISPRQLERDCKKLFGKTPRQCIRDFRCAMAVKMAASGQTTKEIAFDLKFADPSHLCHQVKAVYSMSLQELVKLQPAK
jgi:AraC-like DNA-binding protein